MVNASGLKPLNKEHHYILIIAETRLDDAGFHFHDFSSNHNEPAVFKAVSETRLRHV